MSGNLRFYTRIVSTILFIILVFMNFSGYWTADRFVQILFFFSMIIAVFSVGMETEKNLKTEADWNTLIGFFTAQYLSNRCIKASQFVNSGCITAKETSNCTPDFKNPFQSLAVISNPFIHNSFQLLT